MAEKSYEAKDVLCPFYKYEKNGNLYCEGIFQKGSTCQHFPSNEIKMEYKRRFCMDFAGYPTCPLYAAIYTAKYKEDEDG